jgi:hypothetical protein
MMQVTRTFSSEHEINVIRAAGKKGEMTRGER